MSKIKLLKIGELSKLADLSCRAIRYYEELELIKPTEVSSGGFRLYHPNTLQKFEIIKQFKDLGFTLDEIKGILIPAPSFEKKQLLDYSRKVLNTQLDAIKRDIVNLERLQAKTNEALKKLDKCEKCSEIICDEECENKKAYIL